MMCTHAAKAAEIAVDCGIWKGRSKRQRWRFQFPGNGGQDAERARWHLAGKAGDRGDGASLRTLGVPGADKLAGCGVSQCAWCDGGLYRDAEVVVAGGGDEALSEALHLAEFARSVTIVTRGEMFRARRSYVSRVADDERFRLRWASEIVEVLGGKGVDGVRVRDNEAGNEEVVPCSGLFVFVGLAPNTSLLSPDVARDARGFVVTDATFETTSPGVFAVGAVRSGYGGRLTQAVAEATTAAERAAARCED